MDIGSHIFNNDEVTDLNLPLLEKLNFIGIEQKYRLVILLNWICWICFVVALLLLGLKFLSESSIYKYLPFVFGGILLVLTSAFAINIIGFNKRKYALREKDISYSKGLLLTKLTTVPFVRVQHIDVDQGFFSKKLGLAKLTVYTAGDSGGDLKITGLTLKKANNLREFITSKANALL